MAEEVVLFENNHPPLRLMHSQVERTPVYSTKSKVLKALLDIATLNELTNIAAISVPSIIELFVKKHGLYINSGTIYPVFRKLEKQGYIERLPRKVTCLYSITAAGSGLLQNVQKNIDEIDQFLLKLINPKESS